MALGSRPSRDAGALEQRLVEHAYAGIVVAEHDAAQPVEETAVGFVCGHGFATGCEDELGVLADTVRCRFYRLPGTGGDMIGRRGAEAVIARIAVEAAAYDRERENGGNSK